MAMHCPLPVKKSLYSNKNLTWSTTVHGVKYITNIFKDHEKSVENGFDGCTDRLTESKPKVPFDFVSRD